MLTFLRVPLVAEKGMSEESLQMLCATEGDEIRRSTRYFNTWRTCSEMKILSLFCSPAITVDGIGKSLPSTD
jgi:hypothetical protein